MKNEVFEKALTEEPFRLDFHHILGLRLRVFKRLPNVEAGIETGGLEDDDTKTSIDDRRRFKDLG